jgi:hypothetical protein
MMMDRPRAFSSPTKAGRRAPRGACGLLLLLLLATPLAALAAPTGAPATDGEAAALDELVLKGTHNSYHVWPWLAVHPRHRYQHESLRVQLEHQGVRAMELDLHLNKSGRYEIYHIAVIDERSRCKAFVDCLQQIRTWSDLDRNHEPILIWIEVKDFAGGEEIVTLRPVDALIRSILGDRLITPDDVQGPHESVRTALAREGWPDLASSRGKVLFMLTGSTEEIARYTNGLRELRGRVMFPEAKPWQFHMPWAAVAKLGVMQKPSIDRARDKRMLITTTVCVAEMADWECQRDRALALAQGINVLLDDYVRPTPGRNYYLDVDFHQIASARLRKLRQSTAAEPPAQSLR